MYFYVSNLLKTSIVVAVVVAEAPDNTDRERKVETFQLQTFCSVSVVLSSL